MILLEVGRMTPSGLEITFGGCFEDRNEEQILGWDVDTTEVISGGHRCHSKGPIEPVTNEKKREYITSLLRRILDFLHM